MLIIAADIFCWERRTEWRYFWGDGATGKDVIGLLLVFFLGDRDDGGMSTCFESDYFLGKQQKGSLDPTLDGARSMRSVVCNEVPEHSYFNHDRAKALSEPRGSGLMSRTIYAKPERWWPCLGLQVFSNHELSISGKQGLDTGIKRRLNVLQLKHIFEENSLRDVKAEVMSGKYNRELFFVSRLMLGYLMRCPAVSYTHLTLPTIYSV